jgi:hypothetical protein
LTLVLPDAAGDEEVVLPPGAVDLLEAGALHGL